MKKILLIAFMSFLFYAPFLAIKPIKNYYDYYENIAKKYECFPIETCQFDFNSDGKLDIFKIVDEPNEVWQHYYRLKIFVEENNQTKEILNIRFNPIKKNYYGTHLAIAEIHERKELVIYDTINKEQFFFWDGNQLSPIWDGKTISPGDELALWERSIQRAMYLEDDKGGFNEKSLIYKSITYIFGLYYLVLSIVIGITFYFQKKLNQKLS